MILTLKIKLIDIDDFRLKLVREYLEKMGYPIDHLIYVPDKDHIQLTFHLLLMDKWHILFKDFLTQLAKTNQENKILAAILIPYAYAEDANEFITEIIDILSHNTYQTTYTFNENKAITELITPLENIFGMCVPSVNFIGRNKELATLENTASTILRIVGSPGIGKTAFAQQYARNMIKLHQNDSNKGYKLIIWIQVNQDMHMYYNNQDEHILKQFLYLGKTINLNLVQLNKSPSLQSIYNRLDEKYSPYLIIFDGVINFRNIKSFIPKSKSHCRILMTTRNCHELDFDQSIEKIELAGLTPSESKEYIINTLQKANIAISGEEEQHINTLSINFGYHPLILIQMLSAIVSSKNNLYSHLKNYEIDPIYYLKYKIDKDELCNVKSLEQADIKNNLLTSAWDKITDACNQMKNGNEEAYQLLKICSLMNYFQQANEISVDVLAIFLKKNLMETHKLITILRQYGLVINFNNKPGYIGLSKPVSTIVVLTLDQSEHLDLMKIIKESAEKYKSQSSVTNNNSTLFNQSNTFIVSNEASSLRYDK